MLENVGNSSATTSSAMVKLQPIHKLNKNSCTAKVTSQLAAYVEYTWKVIVFDEWDTLIFLLSLFCHFLLFFLWVGSGFVLLKKYSLLWPIYIEVWLSSVFILFFPPALKPTFGPHLGWINKILVVLPLPWYSCSSFYVCELSVCNKLYFILKG